MAGRIVLFGATGYTGELTARALVARGAAPVLAARSADRVRALAEALGGLDHAVADVERPSTIAELLGRGDVLVSAVGPFLRWGRPAVEAAIGAGAHYLDSTGEGPFIRRVFEEHGPRAQAAGCGLVTAFGYDWVPGNLAGGLALREAGAEAVEVEVGYFTTGRATSGSVSGGTRASAAGMLLEPGFAWRGGRIVTERGGKRLRTFSVRGRDRPAVSVGSSEHFALPRLAPLRDVDVLLGWFGPASRPLQAVSLGLAAGTRVPGVRAALGGVLGRAVKGSTGGPAAAARATTGSAVVAVVRDAACRSLAEVRLEGPNPYELTASLLAWGAKRAAAGGLVGSGALGPVDEFGLDELEAGAAEAGLRRVG